MNLKGVKTVHIVQVKLYVLYYGKKGGGRSHLSHVGADCPVKLNSKE